MRENEMTGNESYGDHGAMAALIAAVLTQAEYDEFRRILVDMQSEDGQFATTGEDLFALMEVAVSYHNPERVPEFKASITEITGYGWRA